MRLSQMQRGNEQLGKKGVGSEVLKQVAGSRTQLAAAPPTMPFSDVEVARSDKFPL